MSEEPSPLPPDFFGFPDLAGLKTAHARLIQQQREKVSGDFLDTVEAFVIRAQGTGQVLGHEDERTAAQNIIDYWVTVLLRGRRTPPETGLAEYGLHVSAESLRARPVAEYLTEERTAIRRRLGLSAAATQWEDAKRPRALLWGGAQLDEAAGYDDLSPVEREFIAASRSDERRSAWRRRIVLYAALSAAAMIVLLFGWNLLMQKRAAEAREAAEAASRRDAQHQLANKLVERAAVLMRERDVSGSLLWLAAALHEDIAAGSENAQAVHRIRIGAALAQLPRLPQVLIEKNPDFLSGEAKFSADGRHILTVASQRGDEAGVARLWDAQTGAEIAKFEDPEARINTALFLPDGRILTASGKRGSGRGKVRIWERSGQPVGEIPHTGGAVRSAVLNPTGKHIVLLCEGLDGKPDTAEVRQISDGTSPTSALGWGGEIREVSFSPDGNYVVACGSIKDKAPGQEERTVGQVLVWRVWDGELVSLGDMRHEQPVNCAAFAPDNQRLVTGTGNLHDSVGTVELRNPFTAERTFRVEHGGQVVGVSFSPDGRRVLSASHDETARVWDAASGVLLRAFQHESSVYFAGFSPDGRYVVSGGRDHTARLWRLATGGLAVPPLSHGLTVSRGIFSPDGERILTSTTDGARLWRLQTGEPLAPVLQLNEPVWQMAISADGEQVVAVSHEGNVGTWNTRTKQSEVRNLRPLGEADAVFFSADARLALLSAKQVATVYSMEGELPPGVLLTNPAPVTYAVFSPDGARVLTSCGTAPGATQIWDASTGQPVGVPLAATGAVSYAAFSPDGKYILTASGTSSPVSGEARVWEVATGQPLTPPLLHGEPVTHASFNHDFTRVVTASVDDTAKVWVIDLNRREARERQPLTEHTADLTHASFSPDGQWIVTASFDRTAVLWKAETGERISVLQHPGWINDARFSRDGRFLVTACADQTARVWDVTTGDWVSLFRHDGEVTRAFFVPDPGDARTQNVVTLSAYEPAQALRAAQGSLLLSGGAEAGGGTMLKAQTWRLPSEGASPEDIHAFAQVMRARAIDDNPDPEHRERVRLRDFVRLDRGVLRDLWERLRPGFVAKFNTDLFPVPELYTVEESEATGEWFASRWHLNRRLADEPEKVDLVIRRGQVSANLRDFPAAIRDYTAALKQKKTSALLSRLARANIELGRFDEAIGHLTEAISLKPEDRTLYLLRAEAYAATQDWEIAAADLLKTIALKPDVAAPYQRLGIVRLKQNQFEEYQKQCAKMLELQQAGKAFGGPVAWACVLRDGAVPDLELPVALVMAALVDLPDSYSLLNTSGAALFRAARYPEAIVQLEKSRATYTRAAGLAQLRSDTDAVLMPVQDGRVVDWLFLAMANAKLGKLPEAQEWLKKSEAAVTSKSITDPRRIWHRLEVELLLEEARDLLSKPATAR